MNNNPFTQTNNSLFNSSSSLFGNQSGSSLFLNNSNQTPLFGAPNTAPSNNPFQKNIGGGGMLNFGNNLFGQNKPNEQKEENTNPLSLNNNNNKNPFSNHSNALFGINDINSLNKQNEKEENSGNGNSGLFGKNNNFSLSFQSNNNNNNTSTTPGLFGFNGNNNSNGLFENPKNENKDEKEKEKEKTTETTNPFLSQKNKNEKPRFLFQSNNNIENNIFLTKKEETNQNQIKPINLGLFGTEKQEGNMFLKSGTSNGLFGINSNNNNEQKNEEKKENKNMFFTNINNKDNTQNKNTLLFSNNNTQEEEDKKEEKEEQNKDEKTQNNPFQSFMNNKDESNKSQNNFGNIFKFGNNNNDKNNEQETQKEKPKKSVFSGTSINENTFIFNDKVNTSFEENNINNINPEKSNQSSLFNMNSNNQTLFQNLNKKTDNEINNIPDSKDNNMEVEKEEIKEETSSTKSDIINNIWMSDTEEIIDDDTDINKKIDYKDIEQKAEKNDNNINDINSIIIPEISEYYFNLMKSTDNNMIYNANVKNSIGLSSKILEVLKNQIEIVYDDEEKKNELINLRTVFAYFDAFILHRNDVIYLMKLRDELVYKYFQNNKIVINKEPGNGNNIDSIISILNNVYINLSLLDIYKAKQKMMELNRLNKEIIRRKSLGEKTMVFNDLFISMEKIIQIYNDIYSLKENFNSKQIISSFNMNSIFQDVRETIFNLKKVIPFNSQKQEEQIISKVFTECEKLCGLLTGDIQYIVNPHNNNNIHYIILSNIFYRFYFNDFIKVLQNCLDRVNNDDNLVNKYIIQIIKNCDSNQIEIVQIIKGSYPFFLRYHMIEILSQNNFIYQIENQEKYLKSEAFLFYQMLKDSKISFKYFLNYFLFYPNYEIFTLESPNQIQNLPDEPSEEMREEGYRKALDYALIYISYRFNNYENNDELIYEIDDIKKEIKEKIKNIYSNDIIYKINKLCLNKFIEKNIFKYAIIYYIDNYQLENEDFRKSQIYEIRKQLCAENDLNYDYAKQFDKVIINFYLKTNHIFNINTFRDTYKNNDNGNENQIIEEYKEYKDILKIILNKKNISSLDNNVQFLISYIEFLLDVIKYNFSKLEKNENNSNGINIVESIKIFFGKCFPLPKCPSFIWYHILMLIKNVIDDNIYLFDSYTFFDIENNSNCEQLFVWDKKLIYDLIKIEKMKKNNISFNEGHKMYENAVTFLNDVVQGIYFNQNIFSNPENNNDYN